ncbi:ParB/RepB/Spo0J family partition protein [Maricaulis maris]|uniref:ParB/RepB/Spo0J family partition protein n=1 Tax=Maricaulis maris TaxID=74318 RepID=A0A495D1P5_9PROT|nr:ParB/RepB/Spo0J family partition protein [Maricaulis maris]RKQ95456.1 ParB/RepB/Spo0J family partition protein [Maricaulis maris]
MSARPKLKPAAFKVADPDMIAALIALQDSGVETPNWVELGATLGGRDGSNTRRAVTRLAATGLVTLDPLRVSDTARALHAVWSGNAPAAAGVPAAPLPEGAGPVAPGGLYAIPHDRIHPSPLNPRKSFDDAALDELADAIAEKGQLQNIVVRPHPDKPGEFEIAAGERRWRAMGRTLERNPDTAQQSVRSLVQDLTDKDLLLVALAENRDRVDPPAMEEARGIAAFREMRIRQILADIYKGDPFEKGFTEADIAPEIRQATGTAMHECAAAMGKTTRWVELRFNLVEDLAPELQDALDRHAITLAQARAIRKASHDRQRNALELMQNLQHGWRTHDEIRDSLKAAGLPASEAGFQPEDYDGETLTDEDSGETLYMDLALVTTLQQRAIKRRAKELLAEGAAFVDLPEWNSRYDHPNAEDYPDLPAGYILRLANHRIEQRHVVRRADVDGRSKAPIPVKTPRDSEAPATKEETVQPFERRHFLQAAQIQSRRLREAICNSEATLAMAITIIGLLPSDINLTWDHRGPAGWFRREHRSGDDATIKTPPQLAERIAALATSDSEGGPASPPGFAIKPPAVIVTDPVKAVDTLNRASPDQVAGIFAALIADQAAVWPSTARDGGSDAFTTRLAQGLTRQMPAFEMTADYLAPFTAAQRRQIAKACGIPADEADAMPTAKADGIAWIMDHPKRTPGWTPPELQFAAPAKVQADVRAMLAGEAS